MWTAKVLRRKLKRGKIMPKVGILMGSDSDLKIMEETVSILNQFDISFEMTISSAHRSPAKAMEYASTARQRGLKVIIAGAGHAAHLAGVIAAHTTLPVIGVPIDSSCLNGMDSLLSTVQMPPGVPVATVSIGKSGARNAGILAAQMLGISDQKVEEQLNGFKKEMEASVHEKSAKLSLPL